MKTKNLYITLFLMLACFFIYTNEIQAQSSKKLMSTGSSNYKHQLGFNGCSMMGAGVTYRYTKKDQGIQFTLLPIYRAGDYFILSSVALHQKIHRTGKIEFGIFTSFGAAFVNESNLFNISPGIQTTLKLGESIDLEIRNGLSLNLAREDGIFEGLISQGFGLGLMYNFTID